jgi:hypothetical protein
MVLGVMHRFRRQLPPALTCSSLESFGAQVPREARRTRSLVALPRAVLIRFPRRGSQLAADWSIDSPLEKFSLDMYATIMILGTRRRPRHFPSLLSRLWSITRVFNETERPTAAMHHRQLPGAVSVIWDRPRPSQELGVGLLPLQVDRMEES